MNTKNEFPYSTEVWFDRHPEKFVKRRQPARMLKNGLISLAGVVVFLFPGIIPFFPLWMVYLAAIVAFFFGLVMIWAEGSAYFSIASGGEVKDLGVKKFRNSRDERVIQEVMKAFEERDFDYLVQAPSVNNQPLQLFIYEDRKGREFYLQMKCYNADNDFVPVSDVVTISGKEYDQNADLIRKLKTEE